MAFAELPDGKKLEVPDNWNQDQVQSYVRQWWPKIGYDDEIRSAAERSGLNPKLLRSFLVVESGLFPGATGPEVTLKNGQTVQARGMGQIIGSTAERLGIRGREYDPQANIDATARELKRLYDMNQGSPDPLMGIVGGYYGKPDRKYYDAIAAQMENLPDTPSPTAQLVPAGMTSPKAPTMAPEGGTATLNPRYVASSMDQAPAAQTFDPADPRYVRKAIPALAGLAAIPFTGGMSLPAAAAVSGLATAAGEAGGQIYDFATGNPDAPKTSLDAANELAKQFSIGAAAEGLGRIPGRIIGGKYVPGGKEAEKMARDMGVDIPWTRFREGIGPRALETIGRATMAGKAVQGHYQKKLADQLTDIALELREGLTGSVPKSSAEVGLDVGERLAAKRDFSNDYSAWNEIMPEIPSVSMNNTAKFLGEEGGLSDIKRMGFKTNDLIKIRAVLNEVYSKGAVPGTDVKYVMDRIWSKLDNEITFQRRWRTGLKNAMMEDLKGVGLMAQEMTTGKDLTMADIRGFADEAFREVIPWFNNNPTARRILSRFGNQGDPLYVKNPDAAFKILFRPENKADLIAIKKELIESGNEHIWQAASASYWDNLFKQAIATDKETGRAIFYPAMMEKIIKDNMDYFQSVFPEASSKFKDLGVFSEFSKKEIAAGQKGLRDQSIAGTTSMLAYFAGIPLEFIAGANAASAALAWSAVGNGAIKNFIRKTPGFLARLAPNAVGQVYKDEIPGPKEIIQTGRPTLRLGR